MTKKSTKPSPWRKLAESDRDIGQIYPAIVDEEYPGEEVFANAQVDPRYEQAWADRGKYRAAPVEEELPQEVKAAPQMQQPNGWYVLSQNGLEPYQPSIFNQVSNTIRRRMWR